MTDDQVPPLASAEGIVVYGTKWCPDCSRARRLLERNKIAYSWIDVDTERQADGFVRSVNQGKRSVPTIVFPDGSILVEPTNQGLAKKLGLSG
jgi:glutaredoxin-like protein